jgi:hypothetical protein
MKAVRLSLELLSVVARESYGRTDADGNYELYYTDDDKGAVPGKHSVRISTATGGDADSGVEGSESAELAVELVAVACSRFEDRFPVAIADGDCLAQLGEDRDRHESAVGPFHRDLEATAGAEP